MPTKIYEIFVNGKVLFTKYTKSETNRIINLLDNKGIQHELKIRSLF